jgi:hypothetical protein
MNSANHSMKQSIESSCMLGKLLRSKGSEKESSKPKTFYYGVALFACLSRSNRSFFSSIVSLCSIISFCKLDGLIKSLNYSKMPLIEPYFLSIF